MNKLVLCVNVLSKLAAPRDQLVCFKMLQPGKILLDIHDRIKITTICNIQLQRAQVGTIDRNIFCCQVCFHIPDLYRLHLLTLLPVFNLHDAGRYFQRKDTGRLWYHQSLFDSNSNGTDGTMTTHRQASTGFNEQHADIICGIDGRIEYASAHHVVTTRLEHKSFADPIVLAKKMLTLLAHVIAHEERSAAGDNAHGITTRVSVDTKKSFRGHLFLPFAVEQAPDLSWVGGLKLFGQQR